MHAILSHTLVDEFSNVQNNSQRRALAIVRRDYYIFFGYEVANMYKDAWKCLIVDLVLHPLQGSTQQFDGG